VAILDVHNDSAGWLVLWLEPLGEDRWLRPGETFQVRSDYQGGESPFSVSRWVDQDEGAVGVDNVEVRVEHGESPEVTDNSGSVVECGHQRPADVGNPRTGPVTRAWRLLKGL
jgi:hypothetical protein